MTLASIKKSKFQRKLEASHPWGFQELKEQITWPSLGVNNCNPCPPTYQEAKTLLQNSQFMLQIGYCGLRAHLERIGIIDSALCDCKEAEQMVYHILRDCSIWWKQRHQLWPQDESTTNKLWGTAEDLRHTTESLATCGLRV